MSLLQMLAAVAAVAVGAVAIRRRRKLGTEKLGLALLAVAALGIYASGLLSLLPDPKTAIGDIAEALGQWTYALVGALAFLETGAFVGLIAPGETVVIAGGVIAGQGTIDLIPLIGLVWICAVLGDTTSFFIGRRLGRGFLERHGPKVKITHERLEQVEGYFHRHGGKTILIGRFIGLVRSLAPFIAGSSRMSYGTFLPFSVVGTALWATTFCVLGYVFWRSFDQVAHVAGQATFGFGIVVAVVVGGVWAYRRLRDPEQRRRIEAWVRRQERKRVVGPAFGVVLPLWRRVLRPAWRALAPEVRFLWERLTPGGLGLELTTAFAVGGVGIYVYVLYATILGDDPRTTPFDREFLDLAERVRQGMVTDVAELVTSLGSFPTVASLVVVVAIVLAARRRPVELATLAVGAVLVYVGVQLTKAGIDRPRPRAPLIGSEGSSFPSGHAAYSVVWVAAAVLLTRGRVSRAGLVAIGLAISAAVGLSRIYLHVHYWSDVAGGWGLGYGVFGTCAVAALVVAYVRHNDNEPDEARPPPVAATDRP